VHNDPSLDFVAWLAQTVHQAYHTDHEGTWHTCPKDICASTRAWIAEAGERLLRVQKGVEQLYTFMDAYKKIFKKLQASLLVMNEKTSDPVILKEIQSIVNSVDAQMSFSELPSGEKTAIILRYGTPEKWLEEHKETLDEKEGI